MSELSAFGFLSPIWLLLLPIAWWLVYAFTRYFRGLSMWSKECDPSLLPLLIVTTKIHNRNWQLCLLVAIFSIGLIALAGPSWQKQDYPLLESASARVVILDLSQSMLVEDVKPDRLGLALSVARQITASDFDGETGLVVFAGASFQVSPLTRDSNTLLEFIDSLHPDLMPLDGGRLDLAIERAQQQLSASITKAGQVIAITDSADDLEKALQAAIEATRQGNQISVLAVGTSQGAPLKNPKGGLLRDEQGRFILAKTDFSELELIATTGLGKFVNLSEFKGNVESLISELDSVSVNYLQEHQDEAYREPENGGIWLVWLMLPLVLLLFRKNTFWILLIAVLVPMDSELHAMDFDSLWYNTEQRAFEAYQNEKYDSVGLLSSDKRLLGSALFKAGKYQAAYESFSRGNSAGYFYNRGNTLVFLQRFDESLIAYQQALELNPDFEDALFNKQLIEAYIALQVTDEAEKNEAAGDADNTEELSAEASDQVRPGQVDAENANRLDGEQAGIGASLLFEQGRVIDDENFQAANLALQQFMQQIQAEDFDPDPELVRLWARSHTADPAEFFRRKFLRDYQRDSSGAR
jgi:Ca-activated chloride channel family protein